MQEIQLKSAIMQKGTLDQRALEWPRRFFLFSLILFLLLAVGSFGLAFVYEPYLVNKIEETDVSLGELTSKIPPEERDGFIAFYSQLLNLKTALTNHVGATKFFTWLETATDRTIEFSRLTLAPKTDTVILDGTALSYTELAEELEVLDTFPEVLRYSVEQSSKGERGVNFKLSLVLNHDLFRP